MEILYGFKKGFQWDNAEKPFIFFNDFILL